MNNRTSALVVLIAVLLIGCVLGIAGYNFYKKRSHGENPLPSAGRIQGHAGRLADQLQLTEEQAKQLSAILEDSRRQIETGRREWDSRLQEIRAKTNERITGILNDQQKQEFKKILSTAESHGRSKDQTHGHGHD